MSDPMIGQETLDARIARRAAELRPLAETILKEAVRLPADHVDRPVDAGGDPRCGLSNHEGPRLEYLRRMAIEHGAVDRPEDIGFDGFGNLVWSLEDSADGVPADLKSVVWFDGHTDTVDALRHRWPAVSGGGLDAYRGLVDAERLDRGALRRALAWLPPDEEWRHLLWGRGAADQLGGVVAQLVSSIVLRELKAEGSLRGVIVRHLATVAEEDNDGGGPMWAVRHELPGAPPERIPDVVVLSEPTGCAREGALGIYRGQRGRMQIEVTVTGKSCHGSMPHEGRNPLEFGGAILAEAAEAAACGDGFGDDPFLGRGTRTASWAQLETPSDCAVPERFTFRLDRRLTAGEDPERARRDVEELPSVAHARTAGLAVEVRVPTYDVPSWRGVVPGNAQIYPGWLTPEEHPAIAAALATYRAVVTPHVAGDGMGGAPRREPRLSRWIFSTDGVGIPVPREGSGIDIPARKQWVESGSFRHPAMFGIGPGIEQYAHQVGECLDGRELPLAIAFYARFPSRFRAEVGG
ncbi:MAG: M20/M25/M40 family metallo-hydrolase [Thermoanaerobaculia bacterium]|nr:M20/M25/M40 family metallo-hydrolase [Thermoanaerobaculia bacterium]MCZ7650393.1 M20/M25/M40 family metallo-hydrolase [Thermoanaerobaculia bacterium]